MHVGLEVLAAQPLEDLVDAILNQVKDLRHENSRLKVLLGATTGNSGEGDVLGMHAPDISAEIAAKMNEMPRARLSGEGRRRMQRGMSRMSLMSGKESRLSKGSEQAMQTGARRGRRKSQDASHEAGSETMPSSKQSRASSETRPAKPSDAAEDDAGQNVGKATIALLAGEDARRLASERTSAPERNSDTPLGDAAAQAAPRRRTASSEGSCSKAGSSTESVVEEKPAQSQNGESEDEDGDSEEVDDGDPREVLGCLSLAGPENEIPDIWPGWKSMTAPRGSLIAPAFSRSEAAAIVSKSGDIFADHELRSPTCQRWIMSPESPKRIVWDSVALLVLGYDVMMTPLFVFDLPESRAMSIADLFTTVFWTFDIVMSFMTGYRKVYALELRRHRIAKHYMKRSFAPDMLVAIFDWTLFLLRSSMADSAGIMRMSKLLRVARIFRVLRLLRLLRLPGIFESISSMIHSDVTLGFMRILRSLLVIIFVNHFVACGWYGIGTIDLKPNWVDQLDQEGRGFAYRYVTALHWSITQFTPASMEVAPRNTTERTFTIVMVFFGLVLFSSFVSSITTTMAALRMSRYQEVSTKDKIRRYMAENGVSIQLGARISAFLVSYRFSIIKPVHRKDIPIFRVLPKNLQLMLDWEVYRPVLERHPLFAHIAVSDTVSMLQLCGLVEEMSLTTCQELFHPGQQALGTYFTVSGVIRCYHGFDESHPLEIDCKRHQWLCEPALWLRWRHRGRVVAVTTCSFIVLGHSALHSVAVGRPKIHKLCCNVAQMMGQRFEAMIKAEDGSTDEQDVDMLADFADDRDVVADIAKSALIESFALDSMNTNGHGASRSKSTLTKLARSGTEILASTRSRRSPSPPTVPEGEHRSKSTEL